MRNQHLLVGACAVLIAVAGCSAGPGSEVAGGGLAAAGDADKADTRSGDSTSGTRLDLPEIVARAQYAMILLERAQNMLVVECMETHGFEYFAPVSTDVPVLESGTTVGDLSPDVAAKTGYGYLLPPPEGATSTSDQLRQDSRRYLDSLSNEERQRFWEALQGSGDEGAVALDSGLSLGMEGCVGDARRDLLGDQVLDVFDTFNTVQFLQGRDLDDDPDVRNAERAWKGCMEGAGYRFERTADAEAHGVGLRGDAVHPSAEEVALATADANCRVESGIVEAVERAVARKNETAMRENERLLATWAEMERLTLSRAGDVLGVDLSPGGP